MLSQVSSERLTSSLAQATEHWKKRRGAGALLTAAPPRWTVAIAREAGSRGSTIARRAGELLGWPVYDRELLQRIADEKGLRVQLLESVDEKHTSWLESCLEGVVTGPHVSDTAFVRYLAETLFSLAAIGDCIIVGRGSAMILPAKTTFRVRLTAPEKDRIAHISRHLALPEAEAEKWVRQTDHDRIWFAQQYFHKDANQVQHYDLVLNTSRFSTEAAAEQIALGVKHITHGN